jgi:hypothetical protein
MDEERKKKLESLKIQAKTNERKQSLQKNVLLQECLEALSSYSIVEDENEIEYIESLASSPDFEMYSHDDRIILDEEERYYIVWDEATLPIVLCSGKYINECWDDVMAVAFDTYFVSKLTRKVIGVRH